MTKKSEDWRDAAERIGNEVAKGLESLGTRVQEALESIDEVGRRPRHGVTVDDERPTPVDVPLHTLLRGDCFEHEGALCLRLGSIPGAPRLDDVLVVELKNGNVLALPRALLVRPLEVKVSVKDRA